MTSSSFGELRDILDDLSCWVKVSLIAAAERGRPSLGSHLRRFADRPGEPCTGQGIALGRYLESSAEQGITQLAAGERSGSPSDGVEDLE